MILLSSRGYNWFRLTTIFFIPLLAALLLGQNLSTAPSLSQAGQLIRSQPYFERNDGQIDSRVLYQAHRLEYSVFLTREGATLVLPHFESGQKKPGDRGGRVVQLSFKGMNAHAEVVGLDKLPSYSSYFSGSDPRKWQTRVPEFARVQYRNIYPGIDLVFYVREGRLEYDFAVAPGADARAIRMKVAGARASMAPTGDVIVRDGHRDLITLRKPQAEQPGSDARIVSAGYVIRGREIDFALGRYDHSRRLVIDPALIFSTFLTGNVANCSDCDFVSGVAADNTGVYITGGTRSNTYPFKVGDPPAVQQANSFTFVTKLDPSGSTIIYRAFLAQSSGSALAVDSTGAVYVAGLIGYPGPTVSGFPTTPGAFSTASPTCTLDKFSQDCQLSFAAKLSSDGATLLYSTFLQTASGPVVTSGTTFVGVQRIAVDANGALYVAGTANRQPGGFCCSNAQPLQVTLGAFQTSPGDAFAMKLNPAGSALDYATYLDGNSGVKVNGLKVDSNNVAYIAGATNPGYPTTPGALLTTASSGPIGFVTTLSADGKAQMYSTFIPPTAGSPVEIAINSAGEAIIGSGVGVVSKLNSTGSAFVYSNFVFPAVNAAIDTVAGDGAGAVYAAGSFDGPPPSGSSLLQPIQAWGPNGWVAKLDGSGSLVWNTFLGSNGVGFNSRMATDGAGNLYILAVDSIANNEDLGFPGSPGSIDPQQPLPPILAAMLLKIAPSLGSPVPLANPGRVSFPATQVGMSSSPSDVTVGNYGDADLPAPAGVSVTGPFSQTNNCSSTIPGGQKCDINVIYSPTSASGPQTGILTVNFGGTPASQSVALSGTAIIAGFSPAPNPVAFPAQAVNITSPAQNLVITNNGTAPLLITAMQAAGDFAVTNTSACAPPVSPGGTCTVQVTFTPTALGSRTGTLTVTDNAPGSPHSVSLSGTGVAANLGLTTAGGSSSSAAVPAGGTASYTLSIGGQGMSGNATLSCTGAPAASTCNVPSGVTVSSTTSSTFNVSVSTTPRTSSALHSPGLGKVSGLWAVGLMGMLVLPLAAKRSRSKRFYSLLIGLLALTLLSSCGGGSGGGGGQKGTPSGTYTLTVTANTGTANQSMNLTLTVQ